MVFKAVHDKILTLIPPSYAVLFKINIGIYKIILFYENINEWLNLLHFADYVVLIANNAREVNEVLQELSA